MVVRLDAKRRLTVRAALAPAKPGDQFNARFDAEEDAIVFRRLGGRENWLSVLKECPISPGPGAIDVIAVGASSTDAANVVLPFSVRQ
jgi:hypothetical protein